MTWAKKTLQSAQQQLGIKSNQNKTRKLYNETIYLSKDFLKSPLCTLQVNRKRI